MENHRRGARPKKRSEEPPLSEKVIGEVIGEAPLDLTPMIMPFSMEIGRFLTQDKMLLAPGFPIQQLANFILGSMLNCYADGFHEGVKVGTKSISEQYAKRFGFNVRFVHSMLDWSCYHCKRVNPHPMCEACLYGDESQVQVPVMEEREIWICGDCIQDCGPGGLQPCTEPREGTCDLCDAFRTLLPCDIEIQGS